MDYPINLLSKILQFIHFLKFLHILFVDTEQFRFGGLTEKNALLIS